MNLINFEEAFSDITGTCRKQCSCGIEYYNPDPVWDFEPGELEALDASDAIAVDYSIGTVVFDNQEFVNLCGCWYKRAEQIMAFLDNNNNSIAKYLNLERQRKIDDANHTTQVIT